VIKENRLAGTFNINKRRILSVLFQWKIRKGYFTYKKKSGALVHQRSIPTERPPLVGEVSANFSG
jgi:hypothetical protein